jgi:hypothetical protein
MVWTALNSNTGKKHFKPVKINEKLIKYISDINIFYLKCAILTKKVEK